MEQISVPPAGAGDSHASLRLVPPLERSVRAALRNSLKLLFGVAALPNLTFAIAGQFWRVPHPMLNLDYALAVLAFPWLGAWGTAVFGALLLLGELLVAGTTRFLGNPLLLFDALPDALRLPARYTAPIALLLLAASCVYGVIVFRSTRTIPRRLGPNIVAALVLVALGSGVNAAFAGVRRTEPNRAVLFGQVLPVVLASRFAEATTNHGIADPQIPSATGPLFTQLAVGTPVPPHVVLVLVESFGHARDRTLDDRLLAPLESPAIRDRYRVDRGTVPSGEGTVVGEMRELCHALIVSGDLHPDELPTRSCLPALLAGRGYHTLGLHGFTEEFFQRKRWWPVIGLQERLFDEQLRSQLPPRRCGTLFRGACDEDMLALLTARLRGVPTPLFVYWVTLGAHFPITAPDSGESRLDCGSQPLTAGSDEVCAVSQRHEMVLRGLATAALDPAIGPTLFVIVGDHAPRLTRPRDLAGFVPDSVPFVVLWPREGGSRTGQ